MSQPASTDRRRSLLPLLLAVAVLIAGVVTVLAVRPDTRTGASSQVEIPTEKYRLANGMEVILAPVPGVPTVSTNLWYHVGAVDEKPGSTGFAHLFEHMMFQGSGHIPEGKLDKLIEGTGGLFNATTSFDRTNYLFGDLPANQLELGLWAESDRMGFLLDTLDAASLHNQQQVVRNERRENTEQAPYGLSDDELYVQLFGKDHPYHSAVIGSHADIAAAGIEQIESFFRTYYTPANATLVVAGNFERARTKGWIEKYFGTLKGAPKPPAAQVETKPITAEKRVTITDQVELPRVTMAWQSPKVFAPGDAEADVAATVLGFGESSRLYRELVRNKKIAQSVVASQSSLGVASVFSITATAKPGRSVEELSAAIDAALTELGAEGPTPAEVNAAATTLVSGLVRGLESTGDMNGLADTLNRYNHYTGSPDHLSKDIARYTALNPDAIRDFVASTLTKDRRVVITTLPGKRVLPPDPPAAAAPTDTPPVVSAEPWRTAVPGPTAIPAPALPQITRFTLKNGMPVYLTRDSRLPVVTTSLVSRWGAAADPAERYGLTQFANTMLRQGIGAADAGAVAERIANLGTALLSETRLESSALTLQTLTEQAAGAVAVLADLVRGPSLPDDAITRVRDDLKVARKQADNLPDTLVHRLFRAQVYSPTHPYAHLADGRVAHLDAANRAELAAQAGKVWNPATAALVLAGDVTVGQAQSLAEQAFGDWAGAGAVPPVPGPGTAAKNRIAVVDVAGAAQSAVEVGQVTLARTDPDYEAVELGNRVLGGLGLSSRLNINLREKRGWTYGAYSGFTPTRGPGWFRVGGSVERAHTGESVREMLAEIERMRTAEVSAPELTAAKESYTGSVPALFQTTRDSARTLGLMFALDLAPDYYQGLAQRVGGLSAGQVKDALAKQLQKDALLIAVAGDRAAVVKQLRELGLGEPLVTRPE